MSKTVHLIYYLAIASALISHFAADARAQTLEIKIRITNSGALVESSFIDADQGKNVTNFSFLKSYTGIENLAERVTGINLFAQDGKKVNYRQLADGEFLAEGGFERWNYHVNLAPKNAPAMAHLSWVSGEQGILMMGDLLPEFAGKNRGRITFELPAGWRISSVEKRVQESVFEVSDIENAVFYVGKTWREREIAAGSAKLSLIISGEWQVADDEAAKMAGEIFSFYEKLFGARGFDRAAIFLGKFPAEIKTGRWEAETRGANIMIFSSEMNFKTQSLQRLHEQLRHEMFHLWLPNGVNFSGTYDWFYEGFALYGSLKMAVAINRIRFEDFLDTLARAASIDSLQSQKQSLIEASRNRWNGANTQVYARGMLVAFLIDVALLQKSKGKTSLPDVLREIYQKHKFPAQRQDGNTAILNVLASHGELQNIVENYIRAAKTIEWQTELDAIGIESATENFSISLKVKANPTARQKDLLNKLGYNNWRKRSETSR